MEEKEALLFVTETNALFFQKLAEALLVASATGHADKGLRWLARIESRMIRDVNNLASVAVVPEPIMRDAIAYTTENVRSTFEEARRRVRDRTRKAN